MKNIDTNLLETITERVRHFEHHLDSKLPAHKIESIIDTLIRGQIERLVVEKVSKLVSANEGKFMHDLVNQIFDDAEFLEKLKKSVKKRVIDYYTNFSDFQ